MLGLSVWAADAPVGVAGGVGAFFSEAAPVTDMPVPTYLLSWGTAGAESVNSAATIMTAFMAVPSLQEVISRRQSSLSRRTNLSARGLVMPLQASCDALEERCHSLPSADFAHYSISANSDGFDPDAAVRDLWA
jgi:hypothetical protein